MSDTTYCTDHGNFLIRREHIPAVLEALNKLANPTEPCSLAAHEQVSCDAEPTPTACSPGYTNVEDAFNVFDLAVLWGEEGDIIDLVLNDSYLGQTTEDAFDAIAPWVEPESFLVFAFGGCSGCFAYSWNKNDKGEIKCTAQDVATVTHPDLKKTLEYLRYIGVTVPGHEAALDLFGLLRSKYAPYFLLDDVRVPVHKEDPADGS